MGIKTRIGFTAAGIGLVALLAQQCSVNDTGTQPLPNNSANKQDQAIRLMSGGALFTIPFSGEPDPLDYTELLEKIDASPEAIERFQTLTPEQKREQLIEILDFLEQRIEQIQKNNLMKYPIQNSSNTSEPLPERSSPVPEA